MIQGSSSVIEKDLSHLIEIERQLEQQPFSGCNDIYMDNVGIFHIKIPFIGTDENNYIDQARTPRPIISFTDNSTDDLRNRTNGRRFSWEHEKKKGFLSFPPPRIPTTVETNTIDPPYHY